MARRQPPAARVYETEERTWSYVYASRDDCADGTPAWIYLHVGRYAAKAYAEDAARSDGFRLVDTMAELIPDS